MAASMDNNINSNFFTPSETSNGRLCQFCKKTNGNYTCPKCNAFYCSLACYKHESHLKCSEKFYKNWVQTELQTREPNRQMRQQMLELLEKDKKEQEKIEETQSPHGLTLEERMAEVNLDDEDEIWTQLSSAERAEFLELVKQEQVQHFLPLWQPWWMSKEALITDAEDASNLKYPSIIKYLPEINILNASPNICFNIINVLCSYIWTTEFYNGDYHLLATEAAKTSLHVSRCLHQNENFNDTKSAIYSIVQTASDLKLVTVTNAQSILSLVEDLILIINGPQVSVKSNTYVLAALSDLYNLFKAGRKGEESCQLKKEDKNILIKSEKKILFYLNWLQKNELNILEELEELKILNQLEIEANKIQDKY